MKGILRFLRYVFFTLLLTGTVLVSGCGGLKSPVSTQADTAALLKLKGKRVVLLQHTIASPTPLLSELGDLSLRTLKQELEEVFVLIMSDDEWQTVNLGESSETKHTLAPSVRARVAKNITAMQAEAGIIAIDAYGYLKTNSIVSTWQVITHFMLLDKSGNIVWQLQGKLLKSNASIFTLDKLRELLSAVFFRPPPSDIVQRNLTAVVAGKWKLTRLLLIEDMVGQRHSAARSYLPEWGSRTWFNGL